MKIQTIIAAAVMASSTGLLAQTYTWRPGDVLGGTGTWDTTTANWNTGPQVTWPTTGTNNDAVFSGTAGTVTISGTVAANDVSFQTTGYTVTGGTLNFNGTTPTVTVDSGSAIINSALTGDAGLVKSGAGSLTIDNKVAAGNQISGAFTATGGTVVVTDTSGANANLGYALRNISSVTLTNATMSLLGTQNALNSGASVKPITLNSGGILSADRPAANQHNIGALTMNGGTLATGGNVAAAGNFLLNGNVTVGGSTVSTISANVGMGSNRTFSVSDSVSGSGTDLLVSGILAGTNIIKSGVGTMELSAANTYTGTTTINDGVLRLASTGSFAAGMNTLGFGVNDSGSGVLQVENSAFSFSQTISLTLAPVTLTNGSWNLFTGSQFGSGDLSLSAVNSDIVGLSFSQTGNVWSGTESGRTWSLDQGTGVLSVIPEPSTHLLIAISLTALVIFRRRRHAA